MFNAGYMIEARQAMAYENKHWVPNKGFLSLYNEFFCPQLMQKKYILKGKHVCNFCVNRNKRVLIANNHWKFISWWERGRELCIYFELIIHYQFNHP
jgi:hypothetical protein